MGRKSLILHYLRPVLFVLLECLEAVAEQLCFLPTSRAQISVLPEVLAVVVQLQASVAFVAQAHLVESVKSVYL